MGKIGTIGPGEPMGRGMGSDEKRIKERYDNAGTTEGDDGAARCAQAIPRCG